MLGLNIRFITRFSTRYLAILPAFAAPIKVFFRMQNFIPVTHFAGHVGPFSVYPTAAYAITIATSPDKLGMPKWRNNIPVQMPVAPDDNVVAALVTTVAKWVLVGRFKESRHPLWSSFVWRNELFDVFYEVVGVPLFAGAFLGTPVFNLWARTLGVKIGKWVWLESHWLPETDLIRLDDGVTINRGCVLQTHLFHDRLMRISPVHMGAGSSLGPKSIALPGTSIGAGTSIGPGSLVMRGEQVPAGTRWAGNPIAAVEPGAAPRAVSGRRSPRPSGSASGRSVLDTGASGGGDGQRIAFGPSDRPPIPPRRPRARGPAALPPRPVLDLPHPVLEGPDLRPGARPAAVPRRAGR